MKVFNFVSALALVAVSVASSHAAVISGSWVDLGVVNGGQVWGAQLVSPEPVLGLDFSAANGYGFSGVFNNTGTDTDFDTIPDAPITFTPASPQPGALKETYFRFSPAGMLSVQVQDGVSGTSNFLGAAFTRDGGAALFAANTPYVAAIFSTPIGSAAPTFLGGAGQLASGTVDVSFVPEPSSLVLGGLSLIGLAFRRRMA